jgi:hypothetical protein
LRRLRNEVGEKQLKAALAESAETGAPLIDTGNVSVLQAARTARDVSPDANAMIFDRSNARKLNRADEMSQMLEDLKPRDQRPAGLKESLEDIQMDYGDKADAARRIANRRNLRRDAEFNAVIDNKHVSDALGEIDRRSAELANLPDNNIKKLHRAQEILDKKIQSIDEGRAPSADMAMRGEYVRAREELSGMIKTRDGHFRTAQKMDEVHIRAAEAGKAGKKIVESPKVSGSAKEVADQFNSLRNHLEKDQYRRGFLEAAENKIASESPVRATEWFLRDKNQKIVRTILEPDDADKFLKMMRRVRNEYMADTIAMGNSQTAGNLLNAQTAMDGLGSAMGANPVFGAAKRLGGWMDTAAAKRQQKLIADLLVGDAGRINLNHGGALAEILRGISRDWAAGAVGAAAPAAARSAMANALRNYQKDQ